MFNWFSKKEKEALQWTCTTTGVTTLPVYMAVEAKASADKNRKKRIVNAEKACFSAICHEINKAIGNGNFSVCLDPVASITKIDPHLDISVGKIAIEKAAEHIEQYGYTVRWPSLYQFEICWDNPKEIDFNDLWHLLEQEFTAERGV